MRWNTCALVALVATAAPAPGGTATRLTITPREAMVDAPVVIRLEGVPPAREITLRASVVDAGVRTWRSEATFAADPKGVVDVAASPAVRGSYTGVDAMGLFWSMKPDAWLPPSYGGSLGGTAAGTMSAYRGYWPRVVAFLRDALVRPSAPPSR